jgi:ankyrin repeat protein
MTDPELIHLRDSDGCTPLHGAAMNGETALCAALITHGADRTATNHRHAAPVHLALFYGRTETAQVVRIDPPSLREAAGLGDIEAVRAALADLALARARLDFVGPSSGFPQWERSASRQELLDEALTWAARNGALQVLELLVDAGAAVDANAYRGTAVLWATYAARHEALRWLVDHGADPSQRHDFGGAEHGNQATALHLAAQFDALDTVKLLLELGADPSIRDGNWQATPREWAEHCDASGVFAWMQSEGHP